MARTAAKPSKAIKESAGRTPPPKSTRKRAAIEKVKEKSPVIQKSIVKKKNKSKDSFPSYKTYIYKVLKAAHDLEISSKAMSIMNSFVIDIFERLANEGANLVKYRKSKTLQQDEIRSAVKLLVAGELKTLAINEGEKALVKYNPAYKSFLSKNDPKQPPTAMEEDESGDDQNDGFEDQEMENDDGSESE